VFTVLISEKAQIIEDELHQQKSISTNKNVSAPTKKNSTNKKAQCKKSILSAKTYACSATAGWYCKQKGDYVDMIQ